MFCTLKFAEQRDCYVRGRKADADTITINASQLKFSINGTIINAAELVTKTALSSFERMIESSTGNVTQQHFANNATIKDVLDELINTVRNQSSTNNAVRSQLKSTEEKIGAINVTIKDVLDKLISTVRNQSSTNNAVRAQLKSIEEKIGAINVTKTDVDEMTHFGKFWRNRTGVCTIV